MNYTALTLRDAVREAMKKEGHSPADVATLCECSEQTVKNLLSGKVSEPNEDTRAKFEDYTSAHGITRSTLMKRMEGPRKYKKIGYMHHAVKVLRKLMEDGKVKPMEFYKEAGIPSGSTHSLWHGDHKRISHTARRTLEWLEKRYGLTVEKLEDMMMKNIVDMGNLPTGGVVESEDEKGNMVMTAASQGRHYVCAYLDDWESASVIASIMGNSALPDPEKKKLLGKLFAQEFPTLT